MNNVTQASIKHGPSSLRLDASPTNDLCLLICGIATWISSTDPSSKALLLHWTIDVPYLLDCDGIQMDWFPMDEKQFYLRVREAWTWKSGKKFEAEKTLMVYKVSMALLSKPHIKKFLHIIKKLLNRLRDGTFVEPQTHAKYDLSKVIKCLHRGADDYYPSLHIVPSKITHLYQTCLCGADLESLDSSQTSPSTSVLQSQMDTVQNYGMSTIGQSRGQTHRNCNWTQTSFYRWFPGYAVSSWAVVDTHTDGWIARGSLGGLCQGADRAELRAVIKATEITSQDERKATIWTDCAYVAEGMSRLLTDVKDLPQGSHDEDWLELQGILVNCTKDLLVQHIPGHVLSGHVDQDVQDWTARWNDRADRKQRWRRDFMETLYLLYIVNFGSYMNAKFLIYVHYKIYMWL